MSIKQKMAEVEKQLSDKQIIKAVEKLTEDDLLWEKITAGIKPIKKPTVKMVRLSVPKGVKVDPEEEDIDVEAINKSLENEYYTEEDAKKILARSREAKKKQTRRS